MTRTQLLARKAHLVKLYENPNPEHELQHEAVCQELAEIAQALREAPRDEPAGKSRRTRGWTRDGAALAAGEGAL